MCFHAVIWWVWYFPSVPSKRYWAVAKGEASHHWEDGAAKSTTTVPWTSACFMLPGTFLKYHQWPLHDAPLSPSWILSKNRPVSLLHVAASGCPRPLAGAHIADHAHSPLMTYLADHTLRGWTDYPSETEEECSPLRGWEPERMDGWTDGLDKDVYLCVCIAWRYRMGGTEVALDFKLRPPEWFKCRLGHAWRVGRWRWERKGGREGQREGGMRPCMWCWDVTHHAPGRSLVSLMGIPHSTQWLNRR